MEKYNAIDIEKLDYCGKECKTTIFLVGRIRKYVIHFS